MKTRRLTDKEVRHAKPDPSGNPRRLSAGDGLFLIIAGDGAKYWRYQYTVPGSTRRRTLSLGVFDAVTVAQAYERHEGARAVVRQGKDPAAKRAEEVATAVTVETVADEWLKRQTGILKPRTHFATASRLRRFVYPAIGKRPINAITSAELWTSILRPLEQQPRGNRRPSVELAHRVKEALGQIWRYAKATGGRVDHDVTADLRGALSPNRHKNHARLKDPRAIGTLLLSIDDLDNGLSPVVRAAMTLIALTFVRSMELRLATWDELDLDAAVWTIPAARMKQTRAVAEDHVVPLSRQAVQLFRDLHAVTGDGPLVFAGRSRSAPISDVTLIAALRRLGYGRDQMQIHGWRGVASTRLRDPLGFPRDLVEIQLAHRAYQSSTEAAYNHAEYLARRATMMQTYADHLDALRDEASRPVGRPVVRPIARHAAA